MERVRQLRDAIKNRYSKPCCIKVGVGVGVVLLLLIVVVVAATVAGGGGDEGGGGASGGGSASATSAVAGGGEGTSGGLKPTPWIPQAVDWPNKFSVQLESQGFLQTLAIDDVTQRYVIEINSHEHFNIYIIVNFPERQHYYLIVEKARNVEKSVLYCESSPFSNDFNGHFTTSTKLRDGGTTYREQISGRTATIDTVYVSGPYRVSATLVAVMNGTCEALRDDQKFQWGSRLSVCGDNTTMPADSPACSNEPCPTFPTTSSSVAQACNRFRMCNYVMANCDSSWTTPYDKRPYCVCRNALVDGAGRVNCPPASDNEGAACGLAKTDVQEFEPAAPCYCRYRISRIYPKTIPTTVETISWEIKASIITAPSKDYQQCPC